MNKISNQKEDPIDDIVNNVLNEQRRKDSAKLSFNLANNKNAFASSSNDSNTMNNLGNSI